MCVELDELALAHILLLVGVPLVGLGVRVRVQVRGRGLGGGRGGQLGSPLTGGEKQGPWASGAGAPPGLQVHLTGQETAGTATWRGGRKEGWREEETFTEPYILALL